MGVWALDMLDSTQRDDHGGGRGALRLHPGWVTGCIVWDDMERWSRMSDIISNIRTQIVTDTYGRTRTLFGNMHVFSSGSSRAVFP